MNYLIFSFVLSFMFSLAQDLPYYVYINSVPKSGTHLALKTIGLILDKPFGGNSDIDILSNHKKIYDKNFIYAAHTKYENISKIDNFFENKPRKDFLVIRDPRDVIVSSAYFVKKYPTIWPQASVLEINQLIDKNLSWNSGFFDRFDLFYFDWLDNNPKAFVIKFEDLIGSQGGGSDQKQIETLISMMEYLEVEPTDKLLKHVKDNLFGSTGTFREGKIGAWKKEFSDEQKVLFHEKYSDLLNKLGYSID